MRHLFSYNIGLTLSTTNDGAFFFIFTRETHYFCLTDLSVICPYCIEMAEQTELFLARCRLVLQPWDFGYLPKVRVPPSGAKAGSITIQFYYIDHPLCTT